MAVVRFLGEGQAVATLSIFADAQAPAEVERGAESAPQ